MVKKQTKLKVVKTSKSVKKVASKKVAKKPVKAKKPKQNLKSELPVMEKEGLDEETLLVVEEPIDFSTQLEADSKPFDLDALKYKSDQEFLKDLKLSKIARNAAEKPILELNLKTRSVLDALKARKEFLKKDNQIPELPLNLELPFSKFSELLQEDVKAVTINPLQPFFDAKELLNKFDDQYAEYSVNLLEASRTRSSLESLFLAGKCSRGIVVNATKKWSEAKRNLQIVETVRNSAFKSLESVEIEKVDVQELERTIAVFNGQNDFTTLFDNMHPTQDLVDRYGYKKDKEYVGGGHYVRSDQAKKIVG